MIPDIISVRDALKIARQCDEKGSKIPFSIEWFPWNDTKKVGGNLKKLDQAVESGAKFSLKATGKFGFKPLHGDANSHNYSVYLWHIHTINGMEVAV